MMSWNKNSGKMIIFSIILFFAITGLVYGQAWKTLKTEHFTVFYPDGQETNAWQVLQTMEYYRPKLQEFFGNEKFHLPVVIDDAGTIANGNTDPFGYSIHLNKYAPGEAGVENWWAFVGIHEYTHELTLSQGGGSIFGNVPLPNSFFSPFWMTEGISVYSESQLTSYQGRLNDGAYDAYIGARVMDQKPLPILDATYAPLEYPLSQGYYNYGGEFFNYLAQTYGAESLAKFFKENGNRIWSVFPIPALGIDKSARKIFGKPFPGLWQDWWQYETKRYQGYAIDGEQITHYGWFVGSPVVLAGKLYYTRSYYTKTGANKQFNFGGIIERDLTTGKEKTLITNPASSALKIHDGKLYYTTVGTKYGYANSSLNTIGTYSVLCQYDLRTKKSKTLLADSYRDFAILSDGVILYSKDRKTGFGSELYLLNPGAKKSEPKLLFDTDYQVNEIAADDKRIVVSARKDWELFSLYILNLEAKELAPLIHTPYAEAGISLRDDRLFFTANYYKTYAVYGYDFTTAKVFQLTHGGYATQPAFDEQNQTLYFVGLNSKGQDLYRKAAEFKEYHLPEATATVPPRFTLTEAEVTRGGYGDNLKTLWPIVWLPDIQNDATHQIIGATFIGYDAIGDIPFYVVSAGYDSKNQKAVIDLKAQFNYLAPLQTTLQYQDWDQLEDRDLELTVEYPLSIVNVGASVEYEGDFTNRPKLEPYLLLGSQLMGEYLKISTSFTGSARGYYIELAHRQYLPGSELDFKVKTIHDPDSLDVVFDKIRGYDDKLTAKEGAIYTLEYSIPVAKIHQGLWNPNIYFEDLAANFFADEALPNSGEKQLSWGMELQLETRTLYGVAPPFAIVGRFVRNNEGENKYELTMAFPF
jgi:hypothetical protein